MSKLHDFQFAVTVKRDESLKNTQEFFQIELLDPSTGELRKTFISPENRNSTRWLQLIELMYSRPGYAICISSENFRTKRDKPQVINADCDIEYEGTYDLLDFLNQIVEKYYPEFTRETEFFAW